jgi:molybdopterin-dependent oxidoreductase alpha subunit
MITGGGFKAIKYSLKATKRVGFYKMIKASFSKNTCKPCALGMGGQKGGMTDESAHFPEVCKKSFQAQLTDIQKPIKENLFRKKSIHDFRNTSSQDIEFSGRLNNPIYKSANDDHYSPISWDDAYTKIADKFKQVAPDRSFLYCSGRSSNEAAYLFQLFGRVYGTNNINNSSYYCHQASGVGINSSIGTGTATIQLKDLENTDLIFVVGANPASNHPRFMRQLMNCRRRGGNVIVVNPVKENGLIRFAVPSDLKSLFGGGSRIASEYLQIKIGGDIALFKGIAKAVIENEKYDKQFIDNFTNGSQEYFEDIKNTSWETIVSNSGVPKTEIQKTADIYSQSKNVVFTWAMGIAHHLHGCDNVESLINLALLRGMIGKPYAGLMPLRGHSNIQGVGSVGVTPILKNGFWNNINKYFGIRIENNEGLDTMACINAAYDKKIDIAFIMGGNLYKASPDSKFTEEALNRIPFKVYCNTTLNKGHFVGIDNEVLILPCFARDEEKQQTSQESLFNFVRISNGGISRLGNARSEIDIITDIADKVVGESLIDFKKLKSTRALWKAIAETVPGYKDLVKDANHPDEFQISNRTFHQPQFLTDNKKANFRIRKIPNFPERPNEFRMMTARSEGQFNSIIYEKEDIYRGISERWVVLMNKDDMRNLGFRENDLVDLVSATGKMEKLKVKEIDICKGSVLTYYPESNVLVSRDVDKRSKTPSFKMVWVKISPSNID